MFFLCSYWQFRRVWWLFRSPGAGRWWSVSGGGLGLLAVGSGNGRGSGKSDGASQDRGRVLPHILPSPPWTWGGGKQAGGLSAIRVRNNLNPMLGFQRFQVFIELVLIENCGILNIAKNMRTMRGCIQCLARRKRVAGRAADSVIYGRRGCSRAIPGACHQF